MKEIEQWKNDTTLSSKSGSSKIVFEESFNQLSRYGAKEGKEKSSANKEPQKGKFHF